MKSPLSRLTENDRFSTLLCMSEKFVITLERRKEDYMYLVTWSPYFRLEKYLIRNRVPAESGIFQIYHKESHSIVLIHTDLAYYGGLRGTLAELIDPQSPRDYPHRDILLREECYARFSLCPHKAYLQDVKRYLVHGEANSGEEGEIFVKEIDTKGVVRAEEENLKKEDPGLVSFFVGYDVNRYS
jgi:hypothetical protein